MSGRGCVEKFGKIESKSIYKKHIRFAYTVNPFLGKECCRGR